MLTRKVSLLKSINGWKTLCCYIAIPLFLLSQSCSSTFFEGTITYDITVRYKGDNQLHKAYYEKDKFGNVATVETNEEGFIKRSFPNSGKFGIDYYLYDPTTNTQYATYRFTDTVFYYIANFPGTEISKIDGPFETDMVLLGDSLNTITVEGIDTFQNIQTLSRYYYPRNSLPIDVSSQINNEDFKTNELYSKSKSHFTLLEMDYGNYEYTMKASRIVPGDIPDSNFIIPVDRPLKKME